MKKVLMSTVVSSGMVFTGAASAAIEDNWDYDDINDDWRVSQFMDSKVMSRDDAKVGEVHDILIGDSGFLQSVIVQQWNPDGDGLVYYKIPWSETEFNPIEEEVTLEKTQSQVADLEHRDLPNYQSEDQYEASNLLGMQVNVDGDAPYGEIDDLMFSEGANDLTAYVVESDGPGAFKYAIPANEDFVDYDAGIVTLPYTADELEELDYFDYAY